LIRQALITEVEVFMSEDFTPICLEELINIHGTSVFVPKIFGTEVTGNVYADWY